MLTQLPEQQKNRIRILREAAGLSRIQLAKRAGVAISTMYMTEDGLLDPKLSTLLKLSAALRTTLTDLVELQPAGGRSAER